MKRGSYVQARCFKYEMREMRRRLYVELLERRLCLTFSAAFDGNNLTLTGTPAGDTLVDIFIAPETGLLGAGNTIQYLDDAGTSTDTHISWPLPALPNGKMRPLGVMIFGRAGGDVVDFRGFGTFSGFGANNIKFVQFYGEDDNDEFYPDNPAPKFPIEGVRSPTTTYADANVRFYGGNHNDLLMGSGMEEFFNGNSGDDTAWGGPGLDILNGNEGEDELHGGTFDDTISGGSGRDKIFGDDGADQLFGDEGNDTIEGGKHNDIIDTGTSTGTDPVHLTWAQFDSATGNDGDDVITGNSGNDLLSGDAGDDTILGGGGNDVLWGGNDYDILDGGDGADTFQGGSGHDSIVTGPSGGTPLLSLYGEGPYYENVRGDEGDDSVDATQASGTVLIRGGSGSDTIEGSNFWDDIYGDEDSDMILGYGGNDLIHGDSGSDLINGGADADEIWGEAGGDTIFGGSGPDLLHGGTGADILWSDVEGVPDQPFLGGEPNPSWPDMWNSGDENCDNEDGHGDPEPSCSGSGSAPVAFADNFSVVAGQVLVQNVPGVLGNDTDDDDDELTGEIDNLPQHGQLEFGADGSFTYTPDAGFIGEDVFTYRGFDGIYYSDIGTVIINVTNAAPVGAGDEYQTASDEELVIGVPGVLINDDDSDGQELTAALVADVLHGQLTFNSDGSFTYQPDEGFEGEDFFTYKVFDGYDYSDDVVVSILVGDGAGSGGGEGEGGSAALFFSAPAGQPTSNSVELSPSDAADAEPGESLDIKPTASALDGVQPSAPGVQVFGAISDQRQAPLADRKAIRAVLPVLTRPSAILNESDSAQHVQPIESRADRKLLADTESREDAQDWLFATLGDET